VIGGNVWLTRSVPAGSKVYYQAQKMYHAGSAIADVLCILKMNFQDERAYMD